MKGINYVERALSAINFVLSGDNNYYQQQQQKQQQHYNIKNNRNNNYDKNKSINNKILIENCNESCTIIIKNSIAEIKVMPSNAMRLVKNNSNIVSQNNKKWNELQQQTQYCCHQKKMLYDNDSNSNKNNNKNSNNNKIHKRVVGQDIKVKTNSSNKINNHNNNQPITTTSSHLNGLCHRNIQSIMKIKAATSASKTRTLKAKALSSQITSAISSSTQKQSKTETVIAEADGEEETEAYVKAETEVEVGTRTFKTTTAGDIEHITNVKRHPAKTTTIPITTTTTTEASSSLLSSLSTNTAKPCHIPTVYSVLSLGVKAIVEKLSTIITAAAAATTTTTPKPITPRKNLTANCTIVKSAIICSSTKANPKTAIATESCIAAHAIANTNITEIETDTETTATITNTCKSTQHTREIVWLLPLVTLIAAFGCGNAGFACLSNPCIFGVCIDGLNSSYSCYCIDGYTGIQCQTNWDECWSGPCQNGGTCIDGVAYYNCTCPDGFSGTDCEENVDECMSNPCQNGGHCRDRNNGYTCTCAPGYLGDHCETDVAVCEIGTGARCQNGGECVEGPGLEFTCECAPGWHGRICQDEINECDSSPCLNGGVCVDKLANYVCACPMGYTGTNCEEEILICSENPCENNALCLMEESIPTCYCVPDYHGEKCEYQYDECQLGPRCMNGGVCIDGVDTFTCSCPPLLTGMLCECLMIGEDSLDCNYTAAATMTMPSISSVRPSAWMTTAHSFVSPVKTDKEKTTFDGKAEDGVEKEYEKHKSAEKVEEESLEKPFTEIPVLGEVPSSITKMVYHTSPAYWGEEDISTSYTTEIPSGSYQTSLGESEEGSTYSEVTDSEEQEISEEFTTVSRFDVSLSEESTTSRSQDFDYGPITKFTESTFAKGKGRSTLSPTWPSYHKTSHVTPAISTALSAIDFTTKRSSRPGGLYPTLISVNESQFSTVLHTIKDDRWHDMATITPTYMPSTISKSEYLPTTLAPFFTEIPEVVVTTKYYDFKHKGTEKDYSDVMTYRPHIPTYSVTTIGKTQDYDEQFSGTTRPGISISVYSPENHTYLYHRPTPTPSYPQQYTTTMKTRLYQETTTPYYKHKATTETIPYRPTHTYTPTVSLPSHPYYTDDAKTQGIPIAQTTTTIEPIYKPDYGVYTTPTQPETATEHTYMPAPTYKAPLEPPLRPFTTKPIQSPTTFKSMFESRPTYTTQEISPTHPKEQTTKAQEPTLPLKPTMPTLPQSTATLTAQTTLLSRTTILPPIQTTYHPETTFTSQITLPIQQPTLPLQPTHHPLATLPVKPTKPTLPQTTIKPKPFTTYSPPPVYTKPSTKYPTMIYKLHPIPTQPKDVSEEEPSANTVSPEIIDVDRQPPILQPSPDTDIKSGADCVTLGCYNGGTCVTTTEGSRCVCRFDRQGSLCEQPIIIKNAAFSGDSYVSHRIHKDITQHNSLDTILPMHVQLKVRTRATNGLIMLAAAQGTKGGHYMALFLQKGLLQFQFSCGLQTMLLSELETPVNTGHEIIIRAELDFSRNYTHCNASLLVNDTLAMSGDQPTWLKLLPTRMHTPDVILNTWLHLGGAPQAPIGLIIELPPSQSGSGFTGCLHSLRINEETREIFGEALDGFSITECGSLACLSSPCRNGAACIKIDMNELDENGDKIEKWKCKCPTGYMGPTCETSVCEDNPCQYGGTCVQFPGSGYLCLCPLGKHGHYCEHNLEVALPSFSGSVNGLSSYVAYTVPIPLEYSMELSFKILPQTMSQIALLAFLGQTGYHDEKSDHLAISFIQGYIMLTWNLGAGPRRIFTQKAIDFRLDAPRVPYEIKVGRIGRQAWLSVDGKFNITGRSPGTVSRMDVMPILYLGGHEIANFHTLPHDLPLHSGFQGCIYDVHLKAGQVMVPLQESRGVRGRGVGQCGTRECHRHACQHDGACLQHGATFTCICQEGWYGPLCAQPTNPCDSFNNKCADEATCVPLVNGYECDCPIGRTGKNCEERIRSLSDVSLTGRRSYLAVKWPYLYDSPDKFGTKRSQMISYRNYTKKFMPPKPITSTNQHFVMKLLNEVEKQRSFAPIPLKSAYEDHHQRVQFFFIEFQLRPLSERGLLLYFGTLNNNQDRKIGFVSLSLQGGVVEFRISGPNSHVTVVRSVRMLAIGEWHKIKMAQRGRWLTLWVEGSASSALAPTAEVLVEPDSLLYIGGLKDLSKLPHNALSGFPASFRGCVRGLVVSGTRIVLNETNIIESRNIRDCDGTACGGDSCEAGGHCWLDEKLQPHCICPEYARGDRCEYSETCKLIPCRNNGRCLRSGRCSCPNGWGGFYCEIALVKPTTPSFRGNSYLILPPPRIPMKDKRKGPSIYLRPREALQVSLNFSTIELNGLLLWSEQDATKFLGLGLENGHIKLASNLLGSINDTVSTPSSGFITDGSWHTVKIIIDRGRLELQLDGAIVFSEKLSLIENLMSTSSSSTTISTLSTSLSYRHRIRSSFGGRKSRNQLSVTYENIFYLGGFPNSEPVIKRTRGRFTVPFKGCLQDIQFGMDTNAMIQDFSKYHGENIGSCDLHGDEPIITI